MVTTISHGTRYLMQKIMQQEEQQQQEEGGNRNDVYYCINLFLMRNIIRIQNCYSKYIICQHQLTATVM